MWCEQYKLIKVHVVKIYVSQKGTETVLPVDIQYNLPVGWKD